MISLFSVIYDLVVFSYPEADVPLVQISLNANLDAAFHYKLGQLLEPLRNEGYLVMGNVVFIRLTTICGFHCFIYYVF